MIICPEIKLVYIGIPRTASASVAAFVRLGRRGYLYEYHHAWRVPYFAQGHTIATVVRNPYERCASLAWNKKSQPRTKEVMRKEFREAMPFYIKHKNSPAHKFNVPEMFHTQKWFVEASGATLILKYEDLPGCLLTLPGIKKTAGFERLPRRHRSLGRPHFDEVFGDEERELVLEYCEEDFERFGYKK